MKPKAQRRGTARPPVLAAEGIAMGYDDRLLLQGVDINIRAGECVILRGDNGAGKTTLIRGLAGLASTLAGAVRINGIDRGKDYVAANLGLVYIGHRDALAAELTVREALSLWAGSRGLAPSAGDLDSALGNLNLGVVAGRPVRSLSAGQKRRSAMLRLALMTGMRQTSSTPLWLLDEPTTAMDADSTALFSKLVGNHLSAGGAALVSSHQNLPIKNAKPVDLRELIQVGGANG